MTKSIPLIVMCSALLVVALAQRACRTPSTAHERLDILDHPRRTTQIGQALRPRSEPGSEAKFPEANPTVDVSGILQRIRDQTDPDQRNKLLGQFAESVPVSELGSTLDSLGQDAEPAISELRTRLIRRWIEADPATAGKWSLAQPEGPARRIALEQIAIIDSDQDLSRAAAWVMALPDGEDEQAAKVTLAYEAARSDPVEALDLASTLPPSAQRDDLLVHAASQWSITDSSNAVSWASSVSQPQLRDRLVSAVAVGFAKQDPATAATVAAQAIAPGPQQDQAVVSIVQRWAEQAPQDTAAWVAQFPQTPMRGAALQQLLSTWVSLNASAAQAWVDELPNGLREQGLSAFHQALAARAPLSSERPAAMAN